MGWGSWGTGGCRDPPRALGIRLWDQDLAVGSRQILTPGFISGTSGGAGCLSPSEPAPRAADPLSIPWGLGFPARDIKALVKSQRCGVSASNRVRLGQDGKVWPRLGDVLELGGVGEREKWCREGKTQQILQPGAGLCLLLAGGQPGLGAHRWGKRLPEQGFAPTLSKKASLL